MPELFGANLAGRTYWLIGASEGLGRALAHKLHQQGVRLILSARNKNRLDDLCTELGDAKTLPMDVTRSDSVAQACAALGPIDGLIYCAGAYAPMAATQWDGASAEQICDVNFMGAMRVMGHMMPKFTAENRGHIVFVGSLAGHAPLPEAIGYGASKAALMHLAGSIAIDTKHTGIKVQVANPGFIKTRLTDKNDFQMPSLMSPERAADYVVKHMRSNRFAIDFPKPFAWIFTWGKHIPRSIFNYIISKG